MTALKYFLLVLVCLALMYLLQELGTVIACFLLIGGGAGIVNGMEER
jgi:hypothetical protein